ncbi:MAG: 2-isopropylmalate synthase [Deltaproteobacteria bacterium]|nr:MAG: 2-isopropylmalate synthase [Deltaproteobacteria bacterium]
MAKAAELIYDWGHPDPAPRKIRVFDETLRDGLQGPSVIDPEIDDKLRIVDLLDAVGADHVNIGLPGAGPRNLAHTRAMAHHLVEQRRRIAPACAARTVVADIEPIARVSQEAGIAIEVMTFLGTSPIRRYVEHWDEDRLLTYSSDAIRFAVSEGLPVTFVTEDTIRSRPELLEKLFRNAIELGVNGLCLCDTAGSATPPAVRNLVRWTRALIDDMGADVRIDWHGHNDRDLALANSLAAAEAGADRLHGTVLGVGERVGNTALDALMVNLRLLGEIDADLTALPELAAVVSRALGWPIPANHPVLGADAFRTATGVHASALLKARRTGDEEITDLVYSGVPASMVGRHQVVEIGPMSGLSNARWWMAEHGMEPDDEAGRAVLAAAKQSDRVLTDDEIAAIIERCRAGA